MKGKEQYDESVEFMQDDITVGLGGFTGKRRIRKTRSLHNRKRVLRKKAVEMHPKDLMLLVEDNSELRIFLRSIFLQYRIVEAANGMEEG